NNYERRATPIDRRNEKIYKDKDLNQRYLRLEMSDYNKERSPKAFNDRVDRHGNSFGNRVATKQTRVPPPVKAMTDMADTTQNWRTRTHTQEGENQGYVSPPYTNRRDVRRERNYMRAPFPQRGLMVLSPQGGEDKEEDTGEGEEESRAPDQQENRTALEKEETLQEFQNKVRKTKNLSRSKSLRSSPTHLGPSLKKRKLAQLHNSPSGGRNIGEGTSGVSFRRKKANKAT
ncbi:hypothetical protein HID58_079111, partial [Brassica napus]